eukprot:5605150-Pleurochrysis_carterae.AAC.1
MSDGWEKCAILGRQAHNGTQEVALSAGDEADCLRWHFDGGEVVVAAVIIDGHRPDTLRHHALDVLAGATALGRGAANLKRQRLLVQIDCRAGDARNLLLRLAVLPKHKGSIVIRNLEDVNLQAFSNEA